MSEVLVRGIDSQTLQRLKDRAKRNGRSLQSEAKLILEEAAGNANLSEIFAKWDKRMAGRKFTVSSVELIREDRDR